MLGVQRYVAGDTEQLHDGHAHHERDITGAINRDHRLGCRTPRVGDKRPGGGELDDRRSRIIPKRLTAEVDRERSVRIPAQDLLKADLVDDSGIVEATRTIGKDDLTAASEPCA